MSSSNTKESSPNEGEALEAVLLLPETRLVVLQILCRKIDVQRLAGFSLALKVKEGSEQGALLGPCPSCGGFKSFHLNKDIGIYQCTICFLEGDLLTLICKKMGYSASSQAVSYLIGYIAAGEREEEEAIEERIKRVVKLMHYMLLITDTAEEKLSQGGVQ